MAYLGDIIRSLKSEPVQMNEANILRVMKQKDGSIGAGDERVLVGQEMLGGKEVAVSGKMKILLLKIADGTVEPGYVRKNMDLLRGINGDKQNLSKAVTDNIMSMTSCEDVVGALLGKKVNGLATEIPSVSDEERKSRDGLEHFYERVRDACHKVFKKDGYKVLLDKLDACRYIKKIYDDNNVVIAKVTTHEGAVGVGAFGASWCTCVAGANSSNMYDRYSEADLKIVFVDRGDDSKSIWQCSEDEYSWCMNAENNSDEGYMLTTLIEASGDDDTLCDIIDTIDNDVLNGWLDEEFEINEKGLRTGFKYDKRTVGGYCIVSRERVVNGYSFSEEMYNLCKAGFRKVSGAEFLLQEWVPDVEHLKGNRFRVINGKFKYNIFDADMREYLFSDWKAHIVGMYGDDNNLVRVTKNGRTNIFDVDSGKFLVSEDYDEMRHIQGNLFEVVKGELSNILDLGKGKLVFDKWQLGLDVILLGNRFFYRISDGKNSNLIDKETMERILPEDVNDITSNGSNKLLWIRKDGKENIFDVEKKEYVVPGWYEHISKGWRKKDEISGLDGYVCLVAENEDREKNVICIPKNGEKGFLLLPEFVVSMKPFYEKILVEKGGKENVFDVEKNMYLFDEWTTEGIRNYEGKFLTTSRETGEVIFQKNESSRRNRIRRNRMVR